ncbi:MAG: hypothetical protein OXN17_21970 [Candidatus Poribacteria bacterium]|nr:hypothetical protein [Candidatus Poribacteria bacterium]
MLTKGTGYNQVFCCIDCETRQTDAKNGRQPQDITVITLGANDDLFLRCL